MESLKEKAVESQIEMELTRGSETICAIKEKIALLEKRLISVLRQDAEVAPPCPATDGLVPLAMGLHDECLQLESIRDDLDSITNRIEL